MTNPGRDLTRDLAHVAAQTELLLDTARGLTDPDAPSLCEGWSRGHVLSHVARNAQAIGRLAGWAVSGTPAAMYPGGAAGRDADIEAGAGRPAVELRADEGAVWTLGRPTAYAQGSLADLLLWLARREPRGLRVEGELPGLPRGA